MRLDITCADSREWLRSLPANSAHACITDPPYGLSAEPDMAEVLQHWLAGDDYEHRGGGFMGKSWDSFVPGPSMWREVYADRGRVAGDNQCSLGSSADSVETAPATEDAARWDDWHLQMAPSQEPILVFRKPLRDPETGRKRGDPRVIEERLAKRRAKDKGLILPGGGTGRQASIWEAET